MDHTTGLTAICIDELSWKGHTYQAVFFTAPWSAESLYTAKHYDSVFCEGPSDVLFKQPSNPFSSASSQGEEKHDSIEIYDDLGKIELIPSKRKPC